MASLASEEEEDDDEEAIRSTALKPTAPMARTTRRESNSATGFAVEDEIILAMEVWPPARGMERVSDLAADPESERDSSVLLVRDTAREAGDEPTTDVGWGNAKAAPHANVEPLPFWKIWAVEDSNLSLSGTLDSAYRELLDLIRGDTSQTVGWILTKLELHGVPNNASFVGTVSPASSSNGKYSFDAHVF